MSSLKSLRFQTISGLEPLQTYSGQRRKNVVLALMVDRTPGAYVTMKEKSPSEQAISDV